VLTLVSTTKIRSYQIRGIRATSWQQLGPIFNLAGFLQSIIDVLLTDVAASVLARLRVRAESFGAVEPSHYIFAAFVPKFTFSGKKVIDYNVTAFDPTQPLNSWRSAWRTLTKKAGLPGFRSHDLRHCAITTAGGERSGRFHDHGDRRTRQPANVGTVQPRTDGSEAESGGSPCCEHQNSRLRHKSRHKTSHCKRSSRLTC